MSRKALVVGGGIIGACCAYQLNARGYEVSIIDKGKIGLGCSHGNCGFISRSSIMPLSKPGMPWQLFASMFKAGPKPMMFQGSNISLMPWAWRFQKACQDATFKQNLIARNALHARSFDLWRAFIQQEAPNCEYRETGQLHVYQSKHAFEKNQPFINLCLAEGIDAQPAIGQECQDIEPQLVMDQLYGGWYFPDNAIVRSDLILKSLHALLIKRGVTVIEDEEVRGFSDDKGLVTAAHTVSGRRIEAHEFVLAMGAWSGIQKFLKFKPCIQPGKGYSLTMPRHMLKLQCPVILKDHGVAATPFKQVTRIGSIVDLVGLDHRINEKRVRYLVDTIQKYTSFDEPPSNTKHTWVGCRALSADDMPYIGKYPDFKNAYLASGNGMYGLTQAPATAELVCDMIAQKKTAIETEPFALER